MENIIIHMTMIVIVCCFIIVCVYFIVCIPVFVVLHVWYQKAASKEVCHNIYACSMCVLVLCWPMLCMAVSWRNVIRLVMLY